MTNPKYQIFKSSANGEYYYHLTAANGEKILSGEGFTRKQSCIATIASVKINAVSDKQFTRKNAHHNYTFVLESENGEVIGRSENYTTEQKRDEGIMAVKHEARKAQIEDLA